MATTTKRGLNKPERTSLVNVITAINNNMENLDDAVPDARKVNGKALTSDVTIDDTDLPITAGKIASTQAMIAPPFVEATPNDAGTFVTNAGGLYYLPDGHTANATWANTTKTEVKAGSELTKLKSAVDDMEVLKEDTIGTYEKITTLTYEAYGYNIVENKNASTSTFHHLVYTIPAGTKIVGITGYHATAKQALWGFYDTNNALISYEQLFSSATDITEMIPVAVPSNATKLIVNTGVSTTRGIYVFTKLNPPEGCVCYDLEQTTNRTQRGRARANIDAMTKSDLHTMAGSVYRCLDTTTVPWMEGVKLQSNGITAENALTSVSRYIYCKAGSVIHIADGYNFNIATYSTPAEASFVAYRTYGNGDYIVSSDCYVRIGVANDDGITAVTEATAQTLFGSSYIFAITAVDNLRRETVDKFSFNVPMACGTISSATGLDDDTATNRMRSTTGIWLPSGVTVINNSGVEIAWRNYKDAACTEFNLASSEFTSGNITITRSMYYRFVLKFNNFANGILSNYLSVTGNFKQDIESRVKTLETAVKPLLEYPIIFPPSAPYLYNGTGISEDFISGSGDMLTPLYALYDALVEEYPYHITSEVIGQDESETYDIKAYTISQTASMSNAPVILWLSNIHASEPYSLTATYEFVKELIENHDDDPVLGFVWRNCVLKVVPVCNPWGLANGGQRYNVNGVNLNRDFPVDWEYSDDPYDKTGDTPASQAETQAIMSFVEANKSNALFAVNKHDSNYYTDASGKIAYSVDNFKIDMNVLRSYYRTLQTAFLDKYAWIKTNRASTDYTLLFQNLSQNGTHGTMHKWFNYIGVHGCLSEVTRPKADTYTADKQQDFLQISLEMTVNMVATVIMQNRLLMANDDVWNDYTITT